MTTRLTNDLAAEHARLKDHVASMNGGLEAKINEGSVLRSPLFPASDLPPLNLDIGLQVYTISHVR